MPGLSPTEVDTLKHSHVLANIARDPSYLPLTIVQWLLGLAPFQASFWLRIPSVIFAGLTLATTTFILRRWYGKRMAIFGFVLFVCSAWYLHVGRLASVDIMYLWAIPTLLASHLLLYDHSDNRKITFLWLTVQLLLLYIPGMVWFVLINALWQREELAEAWQTLSSTIQKLAWIGSGLLLLLPLLYSLIFNFSTAHVLTLIGAPTSLPEPLAILKQLSSSILFVSITGTRNDDLWLNNLPLFDAFMSCMLLAGLYFYGKHWRATRTLLIFSFTLLGFVLFWAGGPVSRSIVVPMLYLIAAAGLAYLTHLWLSVFPRNPIARGLGIVVIVAAIGMSCVYGLRQYFVAWPHSSVTQATFKTHTIPSSRLVQ